MKTYLFNEKQTVYRTIEIQADTLEEAKERYENGDYCLEDYFEAEDFDVPELRSIEVLEG